MLSTAIGARALPPPHDITPENNKLNHIKIKFWREYEWARRFGV